MTNEEARDKLICFLAECSVWCRKNRLTEIFETAIKALEKQIPKEPINITYNYQSVLSYPYVKYWNCPNCHIQHSDEIALFCDNCGQAIDWSEK